MQVYGYNPKTKQFKIEIDGQSYSYSFQLEGCISSNFRDSQGKLIARGYKGFRNKLGVVGGSARANELCVALNGTKSIYAAAVT